MYASRAISRAFGAAALAGLAALGPTQVVGQDERDATEPVRVKHWGASAYVGFAVGGAGGELEDVLIANGYNFKQQVCGLWGCGPVGGVRRAEPGPTAMLAVRYRASAPLAVELFYSLESEGRVGGGGLGIRHSVSTLGAVVAGRLSVSHPGPNAGEMRFGAGPALYFTSIGKGPRIGDGESTRGRKTMIGALVDWTLEFPIKGPLFGDVRAQYRLVGSSDPIVGLEGSGVSCNHLFLAGGVSLRL